MCIVITFAIISLVSMFINLLIINFDVFYVKFNLTLADINLLVDCNTK